jgi:hypothetical protein
MSEKEFNYAVWYKNRIFNVLSKLDEEENRLRTEIRTKYDNDSISNINILETQLEDLINFKGLIGDILPDVDEKFYGRTLHDQQLIDFLTLKLCKDSNLDYYACTDEQQEDLKGLSCRLCYWVGKYLFYENDELLK